MAVSIARVDTRRLLHRGFGSHVSICKRLASTNTTTSTSSPAAAASPTAATRDGSKTNTKERVVVLGSGWAGYGLARSLSPSTTRRTLISPRSHFVFTPLLAGSAVGTLEFRAVIEPARRLGLDDFHQAWASSIDFRRKRIHVELNTRADAPAPREQFEVAYDKLVVAVGCYSQTFGVEGVKEHACFLRDVGDARAIRARILQAFEKAALPTASDARRDELLHFAVVGGGPTGIEFAAELHDLVHEDLAALYPALMPHVAITIYDIAPKVLPMFDQNLAAYATEVFRRSNIRVKTEHHLQRIRRDGDVLRLSIKEEPAEVAAGLVVWSTGLMQNPLIEKLAAEKIDVEGAGGDGASIARDPKTGGIVVDGHLAVQLNTGKTDAHGNPVTTTLPDVYAIGDCAVVQGQAYPATAQVASQQATYLAKRLNANKDGDVSSKAFRFRNWGTMAYLGGWRAIHQSQADELKGRAAWILWRTAYLTKSMSIRNKLLIPVYWFITWVFGRDISRF